MPPEELPPIGLGTLWYETPAECVENVETALEMGYRHLDTAQKYENEREVGEAIERSSVPREDVFLATKVAESNLAYDDVIETAHASLDRLGVDAVDMLYVHWPAVTYDAEETLSAFNELLGEGAMRYVGLGNATPELFEEAVDILDEPPLAAQVEMHPLLPQDDLRACVREHDAYLVAYCPLMRGDVFEVPDLVSIAADAGITPAQLSLAWLCSKPDVIPIPKATGEAHLRENLAAADIDLDEATIEAVDAIDEERRILDAEKGPWNE